MVAAEALDDEAGPLNTLQGPLDALVDASRAPEHDDLPTIGYTVATPPSRHRWTSPAEPEKLAEGRSFPARGLEQHWRRFSYSSLTRQLHGTAERPAGGGARARDRERAAARCPAVR